MATTPGVDFCPICAKYDYMTADNPHHQDLFHADKSLSHVNYSLLVDRIRTLERQTAALEELFGRRDDQAAAMVEGFDRKYDGLEALIAKLDSQVRSLQGRNTALTKRIADQHDLLPDYLHERLTRLEDLAGTMETRLTDATVGLAALEDFVRLALDPPPHPPSPKPPKT